jgi:hypothetical protein
MALRLLLGAATVVALMACGGKDDDIAAPPTTSPAAPSPAPILAASYDPDGSRVLWVNGRTLEPFDGRSVAVPFATGVGALSPDGGVLAVGENEGGRVQLVDVESMRALSTFEIGRTSWVERLHWATPDLLLASLGGSTSRVAALDPLTGEVVSEHDLEGVTLYSHPAGKELVLLVAPAAGIGPARLVVFDGSELRSVELGEVQAGWEQEGSDEDFMARQSVPALAVDPSGARALVVPAGNRVAEVDLRSLEVAYHDLAEPVSLLGRLRNWLEPSAHAKAMDGPDRNAVWLPSGLVAVSGSQYTMDGDSVDVTPAGLAVIDPSDWSIRRLSDQPSRVTFRGGALLASACTEGLDQQVLIVFDVDGTSRFSLIREGADFSQVSGHHLYATTPDGTRFEIIDLETGETVGRAAPRLETWLLYLD